MLDGMSWQIAVRLSEEELASLDHVVERRTFPSRADAVRAGLRMLLQEERNREIAESYRRAYSEHPQDERLAEAGAILAGEVIAARETAERAATDHE